MRIKNLILLNYKTKLIYFNNINLLKYLFIIYLLNIKQFITDLLFKFF
jgi:hypothetical protein